MMEITLHHLVHLFLLSAFLHLAHSANTTNSTYYYNQCSPSRCGNSVLKFPFGRNQLCSSAYLTTSCENNFVFLTDEENTYIRYQLLQNLTEEIYNNRSVRMIDSSLFGCGTIPPFQGSTPNEAQKWILLGTLSYAADYRLGTLFNCTKEPDGNNKLMPAPCLDCGETSNLCYFYDGYLDHIDDCSPFRVAIPVQQFVNNSLVGNLRRVLQQGFEVDWHGDCSTCLENDLGRCGYVNPERKGGDEYCFCEDGIHKTNCNDGVIVDLDPSGKIHQRKHRSSHIGLIAGVGIGAGVLFLCASYIICRRKIKKKQIQFGGKGGRALKHYLDGDNGSNPALIETFLENYTLGRPAKFSYKLLRKYTNNFSEKIGQGGFGSVFKGQLPNGFIVAVKILDEGTNQVETQFLNEVLTIGRIHHSHLVRLLGYCFDESRIALIYEFMANGSLDRYIHKKKQVTDGKSQNASAVQGVKEQSSLTSAQLHEIAIGTAKGLTYLHEECQSRILHCDIKPHNILLDANFQPKVSDFGLAMALNKDHSHVSITHGTGTPGYAPPEMWYVKFGPVTDKSDVYSFGMVLLEMAGQRRNFEVDVSKSSEVYFPQWVFSHHVANSFGDGGGSKWHECAGKEEEEIAMRMELVGLWCIQFEPSNRPSMRKVVDMLDGSVAIEIPPAPFDADMSPFGHGSEVSTAMLESSGPELSKSSSILSGHPGVISDV